MKIIVNVKKVGKNYILTKPATTDIVPRKVSYKFLQSLRKYEAFKEPLLFQETL